MMYTSFTHVQNSKCIVRIENHHAPALGCCFPEDVEKTYDRSFEKFAVHMPRKPSPGGLR
ncbi:MAG: hypothetical protein FP824_03440 [Euryarchaeota archaeon]|nr:hypothetical protein [Euryarchaeota archaeon]